LVADDEVVYAPAPAEEPPIDPSYQIIHEDEDVLVINKSGNLSCHPSGKFFRNTLWFLLQDRGEQIRFVHRLDRETSGLVLIARSQETARRFGEAFERRRIEKEYLAIVEGEFPAQTHAKGFIAAALDSAIRKKRIWSDDDPGDSETAETFFERVHSAGGLSLVRCRPVTGRLHQIRATLCALGFPVVGDKLYGVDESIFLRFIDDAMTADDRHRLRMPRQALHACRIELPPGLLPGGPCVFEAAMPKNMNAVLAAVGLGG
jgi:23S rRNA pseudouridine955/2504/2580 synthase/23S rRNA pseudouridine1911/1915/1917 synthase